MGLIGTDDCRFGLMQEKKAVRQCSSAGEERDRYIRELGSRCKVLLSCQCEIGCIMSGSFPKWSGEWWRVWRAGSTVCPGLPGTYQAYLHLSDLLTCTHDGYQLETGASSSLSSVLFLAGVKTGHPAPSIACLPQYLRYLCVQYSHRFKLFKYTRQNGAHGLQR